jgi:hypothetical protein
VSSDELPVFVPVQREQRRGCLDESCGPCHLLRLQTRLHTLPPSAGTARAQPSPAQAAQKQKKSYYIGGRRFELE